MFKVGRVPLFKFVEAKTHTDTLAETIQYAAYIPANTLQTGDILQLFSFSQKAATAAARTLKFYFSTGNTLTGAVQIANYSAGANVTANLNRYVFITSPSSAETMNATTSANITDYNIAASTAISSYSIDFTRDQYILYTVALVNTGTIHTTYSFFGLLLR